jgi:hypothetical protein
VSDGLGLGASNQPYITTYYDSGFGSWVALMRNTPLNYSVIIFGEEVHQVTKLVSFGQYGLPLAAGVTLYVGASNMVPEFQGKKGWSLPLSFFLGCALYYLARRLVGAG